LPKIAGKDNSPIAVNYPYAIDYTINVTMPNGWDINNGHYELKRDAYQLKTDKIVDHEKLSLHYQFAYLKKFVAQSNLEEFKRDIKDFKDDKLYYDFEYTPDVKVVPFKLNKMMVVITLSIIGIFIYAGLRIYTTGTKELTFYNKHSYFPPAIGGWLIVLIITLFATALNFINTLHDDRYFSVSEWDYITTGIKSSFNRALLTFEVIGYVSLICYSVFCLVLVFKKRDITASVLKIYYISLICFLFIDYFFTGYVNGRLSNYEGERLLESVFLAACWTYYLNTSTRVKSTFIMP